MSDNSNTAGAGNDKNRNIKIVGIAAGIALGLIGAAWIYNLATSGDEAARSQIHSVNETTSVKKKSEDIAYSRQLNNLNKRNADRALVSNKTWISLPDYYKTETDNTKSGHPSPASKPITPQATAVAYRPHQAPNNSGLKKQSDAYKEADEAIKQLDSSWSYAPVSDAVTQEATDYAAMFAPNVLNHPALTAGEPTVAATIAPYKIFDAFQLCTAQLATQLDTDSNSVVRATLYCNKLAKATVYAPGYKLVGSEIDMTFSRMSYNGHYYKIQAKPVDPKTGRSMLTGDVNNRYGQRILVPALMMGIKEVGDLLSKQSDDTTYVSNGTVVTQSSSKVDPDQVKGAFMGGLASQTAKVINADNARIPPKQVTRDSNPIFQLMFINPVYSSDTVDEKKLSAEASSSTPAATPQPFTQPAAQEQQQQQQAILQQGQMMPPPGLAVPINSRSGFSG